MNEKVHWSDTILAEEFSPGMGLRLVVHHVSMRTGLRERLGLWLLGRERRCQIVAMEPAKEGLHVTINLSESMF